MEEKIIPPGDQSVAPAEEKLPYEAPRVTFVPLRLEERLLACEKLLGGCGNVIMS